MSANRVLVTGCAGFIGSTLVDALLAEGRDVAGIDAFEGFYPRAVKEGNLAAALRSRRFQFRELDTRDRDAFMAFAHDVRPNVIVDFAARAGVRDSLRDPWLYIDINVRGLQNVISAAANVQADLVFASSSSVYGTGTPIPFQESVTTLEPTSPYGATKVAGEALLRAHHALTGLPTCMARLFTVYGPRQRPDLAVRKFADAITSGREVPLYAAGASTRDYTFVDDIVDGFIRLLDAKQSILTVNLGGGRPYSTSEMLHLLERALEMSGKVENLPAQPGDMTDTAADISLASSTLGWRPDTSLEVGLEKFSNWYLGSKADDQAAAPV